MAGGTFEDIMVAMSDEMSKSDFFRHLNKTEETEDAENTDEAKKSK